MTMQDFGKFARITQAEVETLTGNRVQALRRVAYPHLAPAYEWRAHAQGERKTGARTAGGKFKAPTELLAQGGNESRVVQCQQAFGLFRRDRKHD